MKALGDGNKLLTLINKFHDLGHYQFNRTIHPTMMSSKNIFLKSLMVFLLIFYLLSSSNVDSTYVLGSL